MSNALVSLIDTIERTLLAGRLDKYKHNMKELWQSLGLLEILEVGLADMVYGKISKAPIAGCRTAHQSNVGNMVRTAAPNTFGSVESPQREILH